MSTLPFTDALPIRTYHDQIVQAVDTNQVTIVTAETGAGKSTQVPQYLAEHGYERVVVTQPRILAARNLSRRVREEWTGYGRVDADELIGYRTAHERDDSGNTKILYCTDGLQLVREITGIGTAARQVLVLDEVHEWNENMEVLVAWAKKRCQEDARFKVVIMSATIETGPLAEYFDTTAVINVPGRSFPVEHQRGTDVISEILHRIANDRSNMLVFLPGKSEIQNVQDAITDKASEAGVPVIPLHSQLEATAQQQAFANYPNGKVILATNIAQTSVTIDDVDVVIDSGLERRSEVRSGVEGLFIAQTSQADCLQRAGRAGRTKPGVYVLAPYDVMPCDEFADRDEYPIPEIMRKHIDRLTLRLANIGIDIETLDFYHDPSHKAIKQAKRTLMALGALAHNGDITRIGRQMEQFPVESSYGRMLVEVQRYGVEVQVKLAAIIAISEVGGLTKSGTRYTGWRAYTKQTTSDLLAQYDVYLSIDDIDPLMYEELGIIGKNIAKAEEVLRRLSRDLSLQDIPLTPITAEDKEALGRSIVAGQIDQLWMIGEKGDAIHYATKRHRELSSSTVVRNPKLVTGGPFDLQIPTRSGDLETLHLVQNVTAVKVEWLVDMAPHIFTARQGKVHYDPRMGALVRRQMVRFGGQVMEGQSELVAGSGPSLRRQFAEQFALWAHEQLERERRQLGRFYHGRIPAVSLKQIQHRVKTEAQGALQLDDLEPEAKKRLLDLAKLATYLGDDFMAKLSTMRRHSGPVRNHPGRRSGWKPGHKRRRH